MQVSPAACSINSIELQNGESLGGDDEEVAAALGTRIVRLAEWSRALTYIGYVCHMLLMVSKYLDMPFRFPVKYLGSRSTIRV